MIRFALTLILLAAPAALATAELVGPESCATCHKAAYDAWKGTPHARAHLSLNAEQRKTPLCLSCHSKDEQRSGEVPVTGVSCETCHGAGRSYQPEVVMRDKELAHLVGLLEVTPASCLACHNADSPSLKAFDPKEAMARIDHWTAERAARAAKKAAREAKPDGTRLAGWLKQR